MKSTLPALLLLLPVAVPAAVSSARFTADLKSFIHGETVAPATKAPPPRVTAAVSTAAGVTVDAPVEDFFRALAGALKARDGAQMLPRLSDQFTMADLPEGHQAPEFFVMGVNKIPGPTGMVIQSVEARGAARLAKVELRYPNNAKVKTFKFDAAGKLLGSDLFTLKRVHGDDDGSDSHG